MDTGKHTTWITPNIESEYNTWHFNDCRKSQSSNQCCLVTIVMTTISNADHSLLLPWKYETCATSSSLASSPFGLHWYLRRLFVIRWCCQLHGHGNTCLPDAQPATHVSSSTWPCHIILLAPRPPGKLRLFAFSYFKINFNFSHLKLGLATAIHIFKWLKITLFN